MKRKVLVGGLSLVVATAGAATLFAACGGSKKKSNNPTTSGELDDGAEIDISGKLKLTGTSTALNLLDTGSVALADLKIYCVTFSSPPVAGEGAIDGEGNFALTLAAAQQAVGCFILKGDEQLGTLVFKDPSKKSMSGSAKTSQREAFSGDTNLGEITLDLATGEAVVDVSQITTTKDTATANAADQAYDFTGTYAIRAADFAMPTGYTTACPAGSRDNRDPNAERCEGPEDGENIWIKRLAGTFTDGGAPAYGIMIWQSENAFNQCGSVLGTTYDDLRTTAGVDLSGSGVNEGQFTFIQGWEDGWKSPDARLKWSQTKMERGEIGGYKGNKQYFSKYRTCTWNNELNRPDCPETPANGYSFWVQSDETGCKVDGKPFQLNDWRDMRCESENLEGGLKKNTCTKTTEDNKTVSCVNISGHFLENDTPLTPSQNAHIEVRHPEDFVVYGQGPVCRKSGQQDSQPRWDDREQRCVDNTWTLIPGQLCSEMTGDGSDSFRLAQLRCYADGYWELAEQVNGCTRRINTNWNAATPEEFLQDNGPAKPENQFIFEGFEYDSPTSGSFRGTERRFEGIKVGDNWDDCEVIENMTFSMRRTTPDSADLVVEMISEYRNVSSKPACVAHFGDEGVRISKNMFIMQKQ